VGKVDNGPENLVAHPLTVKRYYSTDINMLSDFRLASATNRCTCVLSMTALKDMDIFALGWNCELTH